MSDNRKHTGFKVDEDALEDAKEKCDHGELSEELRRTVQRLAYGSEATKRERVKEELETLREDKREVVVEKQQLQSKEQEIQRKIERKEAELDALQDTEAEYNGMLESIEADLHSGARVWEDMSKVETAAQKADKTTTEVMSELKERNPDVPDEAFRQSRAGERGRWKDTTEYNSTQ